MNKLTPIEELSPSNVFRVNDGFFEQLSEAIESKIDEAAEFGRIAEPFVVSSTYFDTAAGDLMARFDSENSVAEAAPSFGSVASPFRVSDTYFDESELEILAKLDSETDTIEPLFGKIDTPFEVPVGYFETLYHETLTATAGNRVAGAGATHEVVQNPFTRIWKNTRWAAAAMLLFAGSYAGYNYLSAAKEEVNLDDVSPDSIVAYLEADAVNFNDLASDIDVNDDVANELIEESLPVLSPQLVQEVTDVQTI